jgi:hypothetical protein
VNYLEKTQLSLLRGFIDSVSAQERVYAALVRSAGGNGGARLRAMEKDERRSLRRLQTEHFIMTGDSYAPAAGESPKAGRLSLMRTAYLSERECYDALMLAAQDAPNTALAGVYIDIAADKARHAGEIREMIAEAM